MSSEIAAYALARKNLRQLFLREGIVVNDNHIGTIGELYVKRYLEENFGLTISSTGKFNSPYDLVDYLGTKYSVKTITSENTKGKTSPVHIAEDWNVLVAVYLDEDLLMKKIAMILKSQLITYPVFVKNISNRNAGSKSHPKFQWWNFLDNYLI